MKSTSKKSGLLAGALLGAAACTLAAQGTAPVQPKPPAQAAAPKARTPANPVKPIDLNKASKAELMKLPGIDASLADKIIAGRPYLSKSNLVTHKVVSMEIYQTIRSRIFVMATLPKKK
jgi:DNA uptake protein ComE-like DNA-binding protein